MEKMILSKQISDICEVANVSCVIRVTCKDKILHIRGLPTGTLTSAISKLLLLGGQYYVSFG